MMGPRQAYTFSQKQQCIAEFKAFCNFSDKKFVWN